MNNKKTNKKITIEEFKMWLEGLETFQPTNWAPNVEQWKLIKNKIFSLSNSEKTVEKTANKNNEKIQTVPVAGSPQQFVGLPRFQSPSLIPVDEDIGDRELIRMPPPKIPIK